MNVSILNLFPEHIIFKDVDAIATIVYKFLPQKKCSRIKSERYSPIVKTMLYITLSATSPPHPASPSHVRCPVTETPCPCIAAY